MSAGNPKGWPKSEMNNYGIPKPVFVIPAAYVNKQAAEWPPGHTIDPCVIPPPEVTLVDGVLTIHGTSINLSSLALALSFSSLRIDYFGYKTFSGTETSTLEPGEVLAAKATLSFTNVSSDSYPVVTAIVGAAGIFSAGFVYNITYTGGATGPSTALGSNFESGVNFNMPAGSSVNISGDPVLPAVDWLINSYAGVYVSGKVNQPASSAIRHFVGNILGTIGGGGGGG